MVKRSRGSSGEPLARYSLSLVTLEVLQSKRCALTSFIGLINGVKLERDMDRAQKAEQVDWIGGVFDANTVVVVGNGGLTVSEFETLRSELREVGASVKVVKNRLAKIAVAGKPAEKLAPLFEGPTAIAFSEDPVAAAKAVKKFSKDNEKLSILGGAMGEEIMDEKGVDALASMPSREETIATIVLALTSQGSSLAGAIGAPASNLAGCIEAIEEKQKEAA